MTLAEHFAAIADRAGAIDSLRYRGQARDFDVALIADSASAVLRNRSGRYTVDLSAAPDDAALRFRAADSTWEELFRSRPKPGFQTLYATAMAGHTEISGDMTLFGQYVFALELMLGKLPAEPAPTTAQDDVVIEPIAGRYLNLTYAGQRYRIYFEEAGRGIPLVCLHTAGADGRQYRAILNDERITGDFRVIAFDMPRHGKSSLAPGHGGDSYRLDTDFYVGIVMAVVRALGLVSPVVMGCSIGGRAVLHLAMRHAAELRAAIGLQSALHADGAGNDYSGARLNPLFRPDINGQELAAASVAAIMAPGSPLPERWETLWYYMQGGPGVFLGDLYYYFDDGDLRNRIEGGIDTDQCPLYLLTGEYDLSATPELTRQLAEEVGATHFEVMPELGHFPMSENPERFKQHLNPVLERIRDEARR